MDSATFLMKLTNVQSIITEATQQFTEPVKVTEQSPSTKVSLNIKIADLTAEIVRLNEKEKKLKIEHEEELKHIELVNESQNQLNESRIKDLEAMISHLRSKIKRCETQDNEIGGALTEAAAQLGGSTSRMHSSALKAEAERRRSQGNSRVMRDRSLGSLSNCNSVILTPSHTSGRPSIIQAPQIIDQVAELKEQLEKLQEERNEEIKIWEQKEVDLESTVQKFKKIMNFNLTNHKDATDRLRMQLKEKEGQFDQKEEENRQLQSKLANIKVTIAKLEKCQINDQRRSRSRPNAGETSHRAIF